MKTVSQKSILFFSVLVLLVFGASTNSFASNAAHEALASKFEALAKEKQAKAEQQRNIVGNKPRSSYFGKNGQNIKSRIAYKIRKYDKAATEYLAQAAYHQTLAGLQARNQAATSQEHPNL